MNKDEQRIAIAEACGLSEIGMMDETMMHAGTGTFLEVPDYLNDLNAIHGAEKLLTYEQVNLFVTHLRGFTPAKNWEGCWGLHATAAQRAEAFLKTLGKWTDSPPAP